MIREFGLLLCDELLPELLLVLDLLLTRVQTRVLPGFAVEPVAIPLGDLERNNVLFGFKCIHDLLRGRLRLLGLDLLVALVDHVLAVVSLVHVQLEPVENAVFEDFVPVLHDFSSSVRILQLVFVEQPEVVVQLDPAAAD